MTNEALQGKPEAGDPRVRFDERKVAPTATPRRASLLYRHAVAVNVVICAFALALGACVHGKSITLSRVETAIEGGNESRLMSYNVHRCVGADKRLDLQLVADAIMREKPDFVGLNEAVDSIHAAEFKVNEAYVTSDGVASDHNPIVVSVELER